MSSERKTRDTGDRLSDTRAMATHRLIMSRESAGLSINQAAKLLRLEPDRLRFYEKEDFEGGFPHVYNDASALYDVSLCWLQGHTGQRIRADVSCGLDELVSGDRIKIIEMLASYSKCDECKATRRSPQSLHGP